MALFNRNFSVSPSSSLDI